MKYVIAYWYIVPVVTKSLWTWTLEWVRYYKNRSQITLFLLEPWQLFLNWFCRLQLTLLLILHERERWLSMIHFVQERSKALENYLETSADFYDFS